MDIGEIQNYILLALAVIARCYSDKVCCTTSFERHGNLRVSKKNAAVVCILYLPHLWVTVFNRHSKSWSGFGRCQQLSVPFDWSNNNHHDVSDTTFDPSRRFGSQTDGAKKCNMILAPHTMRI